jgi:hypothetical protein
MTDNTPTNEISDEEIHATMVRLAKTEAYTTLPQWLAATQECYPELTEERIRDCFRLLCDRFQKSDHGGYWTQFQSEQRRRRRV